MGYTKQTAEALRQQAQYVVDFDGPALKALPAEAAVKAVVSTDANGKVLENIVYRNPANDQWRMTVRVQRLKADRPIELRAFLQQDNNAVSETWTHIILPE
jgi:glucans biosynthesis protein